MIHGKDTYDVFIRDWWRKDEHGRKVPYPGAPKRYIARGVSYAEAMQLCADHRAKHAPGWKSRKAEFESA